jgi:hypothetical protein
LEIKIPTSHIGRGGGARRPGSSPCVPPVYISTLPSQIAEMISSFYATACTSRGVYLTGVHLMGVYLINVHLTGVHLIEVYFMGVHYGVVPTARRKGAACL